MITLEMAIKKIRQLPPKQRNQAIEFIERLDIQSRQSQPENNVESQQDDQSFLQLAGIWKDRDISADALRHNAWNRSLQ